MLPQRWKRANIQSHVMISLTRRIKMAVRTLNKLPRTLTIQPRIQYRLQYLSCFETLRE